MFWYGTKTDNVDKVYAVEKIFKNLKVDETVMDLINAYTEKGLAHLDLIQIPEEKKSILRDFAISLIDRQI